MSAGADRPLAERRTPSTDAARTFARRRARSEQRLERFRTALAAQTPMPPGTCLFVTGSGGRGEMSRHSDLDVFILMAGEEPPRRIAQWLMKSAVVLALRKAGFPDPSRDGEYLAVHTTADLMQRLGDRDEDALNILTARLLLLLESRPVVGAATHRSAVAQVIDSYWQNVDLHRDDYLPIILTNDIVRYWRVVLLNYEAKNIATRRKAAGLPESEIEAERHLRSYKLRLSRCMTCFSAITFLLAAATAGGGNVSKARVREMVARRPVERLARVAHMSRDPGVAAAVERLLDRYARFLRHTDASEQTLVRRFADRTQRRDRLREGREFGDEMFALVERLGRGNPLQRYLVV